MPDISRKKKDYKEYERKEKLKRDMELRQAQQQAQKKAYPSLKAKLVAEKLSSGSKTTDKDKNATSKKTLPTKYDNPNKGRAINNAEKKKIANNPTIKKVAEDIKNAVVVKDSGKQPKRTAQEQAKVDKATQQKWSERYSNNKRRLDEGSRDIQNRAISGMNGTGVLYGQQESKLDKAFNPMGKFISNAMDSTINNSVPGALYTFATGNHITDNAYNNPYEEQRKQGISAMAGNMAGMALNYGLTRSAINTPTLNASGQVVRAGMLDRATNAVMNGTRLGSAIKSSATLGKIGQKTGELGAEIGRGLMKETISDATLGFGQNALINYGEGLRGQDFWRQQALDTALDFAVGGTMEGLGIAGRAKQAGREAKAIAGQNATKTLGASATKNDYLNSLAERIKGLDRNVTGERQVATRVKDASASKSDEILDEFIKVSQMTDDQFARYQQGLPLEKTAEVVNSGKRPSKRLNRKPAEETAETTTVRVEQPQEEPTVVEETKPANDKPTVTYKYAENPPKQAEKLTPQFEYMTKEESILEDAQSFINNKGRNPTPEELADEDYVEYTVDEAREVLRKNNLLQESAPEAKASGEVKAETPAKTKSKEPAKETKAVKKPETTKKELPTAKEQEETPKRPRTALVRDKDGNLHTIRRDDYKSKKEFVEDLRGNGYKVLNTWNKDVSDQVADEWEMLNRKGKPLKTAKEQAESKAVKTAETDAPVKEEPVVKTEETPVKTEEKPAKTESKSVTEETKSTKKGLPKKKDEESVKTLEDLKNFTNKEKKEFCKEYGINVVGTGKNGNILKKDYDDAISKYFDDVSKAETPVAETSANIIDIQIKKNKSKEYYQEIAKANNVDLPEDLSRNEMYDRLMTHQQLAKERVRTQNVPQTEAKAEAPVKQETTESKSIAQREARKKANAEAEAEKLSNAEKIKERQAQQRRMTEEAKAKRAEAEAKPKAEAKPQTETEVTKDATADNTAKFDALYDDYINNLSGFKKDVYEAKGITEDFDDFAEAMGVKTKEKADFLEYLKSKGYISKETKYEGITSYEVHIPKGSKPKANVDYTTTSADASGTSTFTTSSDLTKKPKAKRPEKKLSQRRGKVGAFEVEGNTDGAVFNTSIYEPHDEGKKGLARKLYNSVFNNASEIDRLDKATKQGGKLSANVTSLRNARGQAGNMIQVGVFDDKGKKVGKSLMEIFEPIKKNKAKIKDFEEYAYHLHNIDRAKNGKGIWGNKYTSEQSQEIVNKLLGENKEFADIQSDLNKFNANLRKMMVDSGVIDQKTADAWAKNYPNYIPTFRNMGAKGGTTLNPKGAGSLLHKAKGSDTLELLPLEDQLAGQVERVVTACRMNELKADMIKLFANDPNAKAFGAVVSTKRTREMFNDLIEKGDYDELVDAISKNAVEQIEGGKNAVSAFIDGKKVTAHVSNELFQTMQAIERAGNSDLITRTGKWLTSPMKFAITGGNPVFVISNMLRDLPTMYIQSKHGMLTTTKNLAKAFKEVVTKGDMYNLYKSLGGGEAGYYVRGKGFDTSLVNKNLWDKTKELLSKIGEAGETIPRLTEFISTYEKTGDPKLALLNSAEVTVDFSRHGSSDVVRALDAWTLYLNASMQGLDKFARTAIEHPLRTTVRTAGIISVPFAVLSAINWDNPHYQDLSERVKQNNFCIPNYLGEQDEQGRPMTFFKVPLNREYGTVLGASLDCAFRAFRGEDDAFKGFGETVKTNFLPNNPITDNVLAPLYFNIPENKDFAGRAIIKNSLKDAPAKDQYDYGTSGFAKGVSTVANKVMGDHDFGILGYLKSPMLVDYLMDTYTGYYGDVAQTATSQAKDKKELAQATALDPFIRKFSGDARYSSKPVADAYDLLDKYTSEKKHEELNGHTSSEAHVAYKAISNIITQLTESSKAEKELLADTSLSKKERTAMINELREAKNDLARDAKKAINKAIADYRENPTFAMMQTDTQDKWNKNLKMDKETWAETYTGLQKKSKKNEDGTGGMTADEKRFYLLENGVTSYKQAQSFLGDNTSKDKWDEAKTDFKNGKTLKDAKKEAKLAKEKEEAQKNMTPQEKSFENYFKARVNERSDGKTVSKDIVDKYIKEAQYVDSNNPDKKKRNGSITQQEAYTAIETIGKRNNLSQAQKAYLWSISNDWKTNPYG